METGYIPNRSAMFELESEHPEKEEYKDTVYFDHTIPLYKIFYSAFRIKR